MTVWIAEQHVSVLLHYIMASIIRRNHYKRFVRSNANR
jgi:hypothetical protein